MYDLLEISREDSAELSSYHFIQYISEEDRNRVNSITENAIKSKREFEYGCVLKTKKGKLKDVFTKAKIVCDTEGKVEKLIGITRDITDLKNLEKEQERTFRELNRSNKELEEFAYVASHDLQEPLRKISTFNERLKNKFGTALGTDGNMYLDRIISSTENMRLLIDNLLEFSRISRSSQEYVKCDLNLVMKEVISDLELKIEETNAEFKLSNLPTIEAVPLEMKQLFNNLLSNSIKFRNPDLKPIITINSDKINKTEIVNFHLPIDRQYVKIEVSDNGIGFEEEYAERIFQIFQRLHGKTEYAGSGIGLAICKKIMDNHEGYIFGKSDLGKGASFIIILPEKQIG
jgi:light-regulated signal transduction histidine kinase (bacteriophytochrome)